MSSTPSLKRATLKSGRGSRPGLSSSTRMSLMVIAPNFSSAKASGLSDFSTSLRPITSVIGRAVAASMRSISGYVSGCTPVMSSGVGAAADAQEAGGLLEGLGAQAGDVEQLRARGERAVGVAPAHDGGGHRLAQARHARQQRRRRGVQVDAHLVHAILHHGVERLHQLALVDVVLVLAHADALGVDLHQLGQRILQAGARWRRRRAGSRPGRAAPCWRTRTPSTPTRRPRSPRSSR